MQYLVERYDTEYKISFPKGTREWYEMNNWLFFQNAGVGPMQGQASKSSGFSLIINTFVRGAQRLLATTCTFFLMIPEPMCVARQAGDEVRHTSAASVCGGDGGGGSSQ